LPDAIEGAIGCDGWQRHIATKVLDRKRTAQGIEVLAARRQGDGLKHNQPQTIDGDHGRISLAYL
jgi:hypothetical protein